MKLSELVAYVGDENITVQRVDQFIDAKYKSKTGDIEITFATNAITVDELLGRHPRNIGLIVWLPVNKLPETMRP